jgi:hypothetical protein
VEQWSIKSEYQFLTYQLAPYVNNGGVSSAVKVAKVFGRDYIEPFLYDGCPFNPGNGLITPLFSMLGGEIINGYTNGQTIYDSNGLVQSTVDIVTFGIDGGNGLINMRSLAKVNLDSNYYRLVCADLNSDGVQDVMIRQLKNPIVLLNDGSGNLIKISKNAFPKAPNGSTFIYEDMDGDGIRDLLYFPIDGWGFEDNNAYTSVRLKLYKGIRNISVVDRE